MPASLMTLPYELREQILQPLVRTPGTVGLQYPLWADKSVFVPAVAQVCRALRKEAVEVFYRANVFVWKIDPEAVCLAGVLVCFFLFWGGGCVCWCLIFICMFACLHGCSLIYSWPMGLTFDDWTDKAT
jgi:hypothetical protein